MSSDDVHQHFNKLGYPVECAYLITDPLTRLSSGRARIVLKRPSDDPFLDPKSLMKAAWGIAKKIISSETGKFMTEHPLELHFDPYGSFMLVFLILTQCLGAKLLHEMTLLADDTRLVSRQASSNLPGQAAPRERDPNYLADDRIFQARHARDHRRASLHPPPPDPYRRESTHAGPSNSNASVPFAQYDPHLKWDRQQFEVLLHASVSSAHSVGICQDINQALHLYRCTFPPSPGYCFQ